MQPLAEHTGTWTGTNQFRQMPTDEPHRAPATAALALAGRGTIAVLSYTWTHPADGPQDGQLMLGPDDEPGAVLALWGDSWHQSPAVKVLHGQLVEDGASVEYAYAEGWLWRIALTAADPATLRLQMDNVVPENPVGPAGAYWAMLAELRRD